MNRAMDRRAVLRGGLGLAAAAVGGSSVAACTVGEQAAPTRRAKHNLVIVQWTNVPAVEVTRKINAAFEKENPGVTVTMRHAPNPNNAYGALVNSQLAAKSVDIVAQFALTPSAFPPKYTEQKPGGFAALVAAGKAVDLTDTGFMKRYEKSQQQYAFGYEGRQYGLMAAQYPAYGGLFYKKALLEKHSVPLPSTWDELIQAFDTLKSKGLTPLFLAAKDGYQMFVWHGILTHVDGRKTVRKSRGGRCGEGQGVLAGCGDLERSPVPRGGRQVPEGHAVRPAQRLGRVSPDRAGRMGGEGGRLPVPHRWNVRCGHHRQGQPQA
ncbi:ABC transporter substrate-binding protein [Actinopolymorpha singaporensis]